MKQILLIIGNCVALIGIYCILDSAYFESYQAVARYFPENSWPNFMLFSSFVGLPIMGLLMLFVKKWYTKLIGIIYLFFFTWALELLATAFV
jgi:hypothetical protein